LILGGALFVLLAAPFIGWGLSKSAEYQREADYHAAEYARDTYEKVGKSCLRLAPVDKAQCIAEAYHERRANERDEQDLVAQRQSALWAYVMGAAAVIGMWLSAIGVLLVWTTFRATKEANAIALADSARAERQASESASETAKALVHAQRNADAAAKQAEIAERTAKHQLRAYLRVEMHGSGRVVANQTVKYSVKVTNVGLTPASAVMAATTVYTRQTPIAEERHPDPPRNGDEGVIIFPKADIVVDEESDFVLPEAFIPEAKAERCAVVFAGTIFYKDIFGDDHVTEFHMTFSGERCFRTGAPKISKFGNIAT
jgi:hypothetical protein